jgi:KDO2-lipid IV(A) lauroyltransferase
VRNRLEQFAVRVVGAWVRLLSPGAARWVARALGSLVWRLGVRRRVTEDNLAHAFPEMDQQQRNRIGRGSYEALVLTAVEFLRLTPASVGTPEMRVRFIGWEHLEQARQRGRGAIIASAHMGNWEVVGAATVAAGMPSTMLVQTLRNRVLDQELCDRRRRMGLEVLERGMALRRVRAHLDGNRLVAIMCDQDARQRGVFVPFFGREASTHQGAAQLAFREQVPLLPYLAYRHEDGTHVVEINPALKGPPGCSEDVFVRHTMESFHVLLEAMVRRFPSQYLWQHRRWKTAPAAADSPLATEALRQPGASADARRPASSSRQ